MKELIKLYITKISNRIPISTEEQERYEHLIALYMERMKHRLETYK
jgi:hypothetical protein